MNRVISWEVLNRQLIWHEVSELLLSALPLLSTVSTRSMFPFLRNIVKWESHSGEVGTLIPMQMSDFFISYGCCGVLDIAGNGHVASFLLVFVNLYQLQYSYVDGFHFLLFP